MIRPFAWLSVLIFAGLVACTPAAPATSLPVAQATARAIPVLPTETPAPPTPTATRVVVQGAVATPEPARGTATSASAARNIFGVQAPSDTWTIDRRIAAAKTLGTAYFRPADVVVDQWRSACADCAPLATSGLKIALGVRATQSANRRLDDAAAFQRTVAGIIDQYRAELIFVEHDEARTDTTAFLPVDYASELKAACDAAHSRRSKCANGGLGSQQALMLVWAGKFEQAGASTACVFAQRAMDAASTATLCAARSLDRLPPQMQSDISRGRAFMAAYKSAGADYVSLNWNLADATLLEEAVTYARATAGLPVVIKELSLAADNASAVTAWLQKVIDLGLAAAIWNGPEAGKAGALLNADGTLRANGKAVQDFMLARFK
ncbi:MAG: hypothetical protein HZB53_04540 [Chloroflexi bacterium]|nr:hypothetical protein [Chloroflexota bacterium]